MSMSNAAPPLESHKTLSVSDKGIFESSGTYLDRLIKSPRRIAEEKLANENAGKYIDVDNQYKLARTELFVKSVPIVTPYILGGLVIFILIGYSLNILMNSSANDLEKTQAKSNLMTIAVGAGAFMFGKKAEETKAKNS
jgi:hypothetical protein